MENLNYFHRLQQQANAACDQCIEIARNTNDTRTQYLANQAAQLCMEICQCCNPEAPQADVQSYSNRNWAPQTGVGWNQGNFAGYQGAPVPTSYNFERIQQLANEVCACCLEISRTNSDPRIQFLANSANQCCLDVCQCCNVESKHTAAPQSFVSNKVPFNASAYGGFANRPQQQPYGFAPYQ